MVDITLPPINITATEPGYPDVNTNGLPNPGPSPAVIFLMQQQSRNPYYAQGLWREMLIKLADEQLNWSQNGNIAPGFTYDLQVVPYADYYIFLHPGNDVNGALYYASTNYVQLTNGVAACPGLTGNQLTPVAAFGHFVYGHGAAAETSIASFGLNSSNFSSPLLDAALAAAPVGTVTPILVESIPAVGSVSDWQLLSWIENTSFKVEGTVNKDAVGNYQFDGKISAGNVTYNTIPENLKTAVGEAAATQLQYVAQNLNATPFEITINGDTPVTISKQLTPEEVAAANAAAAAAAAAAAEAARVAAFKSAHTFKLPAAGATQLSAAGGSVVAATGSQITLEGALQAGKAVLGTVFSSATAVGLFALLYPSPLGNGELPPTTLNLPAKDLAPNLPANLQDVAAAGGTVDVPYRIIGDQSKYSLVNTQATGGVSPAVPVRALVFDPVANAYTFTGVGAEPFILTFPIAVPGNSSTATPAQPVQNPVYTGITLTPVEIEAEPFPAAEQSDFRDGIYVYPADSGLPPIYAVYSNPYEGADTKGEYSGRMYNPDKAGGPTQNLDWTTAAVTQEGIDLVKLHTGRFGPSDANTVMIDRLEKILSGEMAVTDIDKRFYTHETRELERYRALGIADGVSPADGGATWNNAHAATLEDYKLKDGQNLFYTPEALEAGRIQDEREAK